MEKGLIYYVVTEGEVAYASRSRNKALQYKSQSILHAEEAIAEDYAYDMFDENRDENDDTDIAVIASYEDGRYEVRSVNLSQIKDEFQEIGEFTYNDIIQKLDSKDFTEHTMDELLN